MFFIFIILCLLLLLPKLEHFNTTNDQKQIKAFTIFKDTMLKSTPFFETDQLLKNTTYYENDNKDLTRTVSDRYGQTGWDKCKLSCKGHCVEYGMTGSAWCFE